MNNDTDFWTFAETELRGALDALPPHATTPDPFHAGCCVLRVYMRVLGEKAKALPMPSAAPAHEEWCVICKREPRDHTDAEFRACMATCGKYDGGKLPSLEDVAAARSSGEADPVALDSWIKEMVDTWTEGDNQAEHFRRDVETLLRIARAAQFTRVEPKEKP